MMVSAMALMGADLKTVGRWRIAFDEAEGMLSLDNDARQVKLEGRLGFASEGKAWRVVASRDDFAVPADFLDWNPTMHHSRPDAADLTRRFLDAADTADAEPALFYVWGHSFEFRTEEDWAKMDALCALFGGRDDVWAATNVEICRYVLAFRALRGSLDGRILENPTAIPLFLRLGGREILLAPGAAFRAP